MSPLDPARPQTLRIGFIGAGRLGTALAWSFAERGLRVAGVASAIRDHALQLSGRIPGCEVADDAQRVADACDLVFVTTPDGAIESAAAQVHWRRGTAVVHCSGATEVEALRKAADDGAHIGGFHPMQTFGDPAAAARTLPGCTITVEAGKPLDALLVALAERLECRVNRLPAGMRGRYHAAAGYTSQFINVLFREAADLWRTWGATEDDAVRALLPLAQGTLASIASAGVAGGMPGPVSRGDVDSVAKHVASLEPLAPDTLDLYRPLCERTVRLALEHGVIDGATAERMRSTLDAAPQQRVA